MTTHGVKMPARVAVCALVLGLAGRAAVADPLTLTLTFELSNFVGLYDVWPSPLASVAGSVTVTLDTDVTVSNEFAGLTVNSLSLPIGSPFVYSYNSAAQIFCLWRCERRRGRHGIRHAGLLAVGRPSQPRGPHFA